LGGCVGGREAEKNSERQRASEMERERKGKRAHRKLRESARARDHGRAKREMIPAVGITVTKFDCAGERARE